MSEPPADVLAEFERALEAAAVAVEAEVEKHVRDLDASGATVPAWPKPDPDRVQSP